MMALGRGGIEKLFEMQRWALRTTEVTS